MNTNTDRTYKAVILKIDNCFPNIIRRVIGPFKSDDSAQLHRAELETNDRDAEYVYTVELLDPPEFGGKY